LAHEAGWESGHLSNNANRLWKAMMEAGVGGIGATVKDVDSKMVRHNPVHQTYE